MSGVNDNPTQALLPEDMKLHTPPPPAMVEANAEAEKEDEQIKAVADMPGWKIIDQYLENTIADRENIQSLLAETAESAEDFHFRGRVNTEVAKILRTVRERVNHDARTEQ